MLLKQLFINYYIKKFTLFVFIYYIVVNFFILIMKIFQQYLSCEYIHILYHLFPNKHNDLNKKQIYSTECLINKTSLNQYKQYQFIYLHNIKHWSVKKFKHVKLLILNDNINTEIELPDKLKQVDLGYIFNLRINLPKELKNVRFGWYYNQPTKLPESLKHVKFGINYNQLTNLPKNLKTAKFPKNFDKQNIISDPENKTKIEFKDYMKKYRSQN